MAAAAAASRLALVDAPVFAPKEPEHPVAFPVDRQLDVEPENETDWSKMMDIALFVVLIGVGVHLMAEFQTSSVVGGLLFNAGFTPLVLTSWALVTGTSMFRRQNAVKALTSGILFTAGYSLMVRAGDTSFEEVWDTLGPAFLEIGALFFIENMFFMGEGDEQRIERLEKQLVEAQSSTGAGMALSYFYSFALPLAKDLAGIAQQGKSRVVLIAESRGADPQELEFVGKKMVILVPRSLSAVDLRSASRAVGAQQGVFKDYSAHRQFSVPFVNASFTEGAKKCSGLFNFPAIVMAVWDRHQEQREKLKDDPDALQVDIPREMRDFQNRLLALVQSNAVTRDHLRIVSVPPLPVDRESIVDLLDKLGEL